MGAVSPPRPIHPDDNLAAFDCGQASLNGWLVRHALKNQSSGGSRTSVMTDSDGAIVGFVSLSMASISREALSSSMRRNQPDPVPAILLGQLAVDREWQGQGIAASLLFFACRTAVRIADELGCVCVVTHPVSEAAERFYSHFDFEAIPGAEGTMAVRIATLRQSGF